MSNSHSFCMRLMHLPYKKWAIEWKMQPNFNQLQIFYHWAKISPFQISRNCLLWGRQVCQPQDLAMWPTHPLRNKQISESSNIAPNPLIIPISRVRGIWGNSSNNGSRNDVTWVDLNQNIPVLLVEPEKSPTMSCLFRICSE